MATAEAAELLSYSGCGPVNRIRITKHMKKLVLSGYSRTSLNGAVVENVRPCPQKRRIFAAWRYRRLLEDYGRSNNS
ncbi:unnamed protein product [Boreogadus saida]